VKKIIALLALAVSVAACSKSSPSGSAAPSAPATPAVAAPREAKDLLADDKVVAGFAVYQKEMAPRAKETMEVFAAATSEGAKDDPRVAAYAGAHQAALAKGGITDHEMRTLSMATSGYVATVAIAKGAGDEAAQVQAAEEKFAAQYGAAALATVKKNLPALLEAQELTMKAMLGK
jgi:hypothetical protein